MGKSTVGAFLAAALPTNFACIELEDVLPSPPNPDKAYRQEAARQAVILAIELQTQGKHLVLASDPVAAGELLAVPEAEGLEGIAVCVLDADERTQIKRLKARAETEEALGHHVAFARWMRAHAQDPQHMQHVLDTTDLCPAAVGSAVLDWINDAKAGRAPVFASN